MCIRDRCIHVGRGAFGNRSGHAFDKIDKFFVLAHEVSLGVDFHYHADAVKHSGISHAFCGNAAGLFLGSGQTLFAQDLNCLVYVADVYKRQKDAREYIRLIRRITAFCGTHPFEPKYSSEESGVCIQQERD